VEHWIKAYRLGGEVGQKNGPSGPRKARLPEAISEKIIELKQQNPTFGIKRISQMLRRLFFLPASPETVREHLNEADLMPESSPPKKRNMVRPRFFERATPNQMWQSDIFTFRLGGRYAYLIAFMDDYSRFMVGAAGTVAFEFPCFICGEPFPKAICGFCLDAWGPQERPIREERQVPVQG
jgi:transposase